MTLKLRQLADNLKLEYRGDGDLDISGVASLASAGIGDMCFILHRRYLPELAASDCTAVILTPELAQEVEGKAALLSPDPQFSFVQVIAALGIDGSEPESASIHPSAQIDDKAVIGDDVSIGALAVVGAGAEIGSQTVIGAGSIVERGARIGRNCRLHSGVTVAHGVRIGDRCILHSGAVIGADGFGLVMHEARWQKIPQLGSVRIEDDVEIGANTTIDRGALDDTLIERGCKLDNLIQVAHNVRIGAHTAIAACVGIAGSADIGCHCRISGAAVVLGHLTIVDHVTVTAMSLVTKDIRRPGTYSSGTPLLENSLWHRANARYKSLDKLAQTVARLDKSAR